MESLRVRNLLSGTKVGFFKGTLYTFTYIVLIASQTPTKPSCCYVTVTFKKMLRFLDMDKRSTYMLHSDVKYGTAARICGSLRSGWFNKWKKNPVPLLLRYVVKTQHTKLDGSNLYDIRAVA